MDLTNLPFSMPPIARGASPLDQLSLITFLDEDSANLSRAVNSHADILRPQYMARFTGGSGLNGSNEIILFTDGYIESNLAAAGVTLDMTNGQISLNNDNGLNVTYLLSWYIELTGMTHALNTVFTLLENTTKLGQMLYANAGQDAIIFTGQRTFTEAGDKDIKLSFTESTAGNVNVSAEFSIELLGVG